MQCDNLGSTAVPRSFGSDDPPPPAYIRRTESQREPKGKIVDRCNKSVWIRYQADGKVEVNGSVPTSHTWPDAVDTYEDLIVSAASKYIVPAAWVAGFIAVESRGAPGALGPVGSVGLMQLQVSTAKWLSDPAFPGQTPGHEGPTREQLSDPVVNIDLGTKFLSHLMDKHDGNLMYMAGEYNHGSAECGSEVGLKNPDGTRQPCPTPEHDFALITHCGYIDNIIERVNRAVVEGYSGLREIDLDTDPTTGSEGTSSSSFWGVLFAMTVGAGALAAWKYASKR